jgi:hypothetical protein
MSDFELLLDEDNELRFSVAVEGSGTGSVKSRFLINKTDGFALCFEGHANPEGEVEVEVPPLTGVLKEGTYATRLEVLVDDRIFVPLEMTAKIKKSIKVEATIRTSRKKSKTSVAAQIVSEARPVVKKSKPKKASSAPKSTNDLDKLLKEIENI